MKFYSDLAKNIQPYIAGEQPQDKKYIKLNTNENPYPPSPSCKKLLDNFDCEVLKKYPDPDCIKLRKAISERYCLKIDNVFVGNGSDEILAFAFGAFFNSDDIVVINNITYSFYPVYADFYGIKTHIIPLTEKFTIDIDKYLNIDAKGIVIANPNAPTSIALRREDIETVIRNNRDKMIIIDEAYIDFCNESVIDLTNEYDNLLVVKTFSKSYSLAGARCGFCVGNSNLINALNRIKNSFNSYTVNALTQSLALNSFMDTEYFDMTTKKIKTVRDKTIKTLIELGYNVFPSDSNFLFLGHPNAKERYLNLKDNGILVRYFDKPQINEFLRVTIGTAEEMEIFINTLKALDQKC